MSSRKKQHLEEDERCFPNPYLKDASCLISSAADPKAQVYFIIAYIMLWVGLIYLGLLPLLAFLLSFRRSFSPS